MEILLIMSNKKEKQEPYVYEYTREIREINPILNKPTNYELEQLKAEIKRVNAILRETHNPNEYRQNKKYLERLERKLRNAKEK